MNFAAPLVLIGLLAPGLLAVGLLRRRRGRARAADAFAAPALLASAAPRRPGWRVLVAPLALCLALALAVTAAARPRVRHRVPVTAGTVMLINDVSNSMTATDVRPSRLAAAKAAATTFIDRAPATLAVGSIDFARHPVLLQSPSTDHALARQAVASLSPGGGGTAIGEAVETGLTQIARVPKVDGHRPPGAIVLLSDGTSNVGVSPATAAQLAHRDHVPIDTIAIGTSRGTIVGRRHGRETTIPVPVSPGELEEVAKLSGGTFSPAPSSREAAAIYAGLATRLGTKEAELSLLPEVGAAGALVLILGAGLSLYWFGRLT